MWNLAKNRVELQVRKTKGVEIKQDMIGLFFEDINYAADGGLYAEMLENRAFEFVQAFGDARDYYIKYDGEYGWSPYPDASAVRMQAVTGSAHVESNPHYMRIETREQNAGIANQAYEGIYLEKGETYHVYFWARLVKAEGNIVVKVQKEGKVYASSTISTTQGTNETYNFYKRYDLLLKAEESVEKAQFIFALENPGIIELDFISMIPDSAVEGIFRKDLYEKLKELKPGFLRFPGGCIVEGNTLDNRYRYKDSLKPVWERNNNWNRWAVHCNDKDNDWCGPYSHYNQSLGLGYYEYFLLCEMIGAKAIPVMNVGFACQYQSEEMVAIGSEKWDEFVQDALDLIEFANGDVSTKWGSVRAKMGHPKSFGLSMLGIGNEQWQTAKADFFERYVIFEKEIHARYPEIKLIGSAGPDITSERYAAAWDFYNEHKAEADFVYAVDEHYYVKPQWLYDHVDFYDEYDRTIKVFSGEYAAHPRDGMNMPHANTLEGALSEAAFLTGVERNADVVVLASYAPLFARVGYAQWSPDMIWFDAKTSYGSPSYYVQKMYGNNLGDVTLATEDEVKKAWEEKIYYALSYKQDAKEIIVKIVNANDVEKQIDFNLEEWSLVQENCAVELLTGPELDASNSIESPEYVGVRIQQENVKKGICMPANSFAVVRINAE